MKCRPNCAACCIAISISSPIPGMPHGKPAGMRCIHLTSENGCKLFGLPSRPQVCSDFKPELQFCGESTEEAFAILSELEG